MHEQGFIILYLKIKLVVLLVSDFCWCITNATSMEDWVSWCGSRYCLTESCTHIIRWLSGYHQGCVIWRSDWQKNLYLSSLQFWEVTLWSWRIEGSGFLLVLGHRPPSGPIATTPCHVRLSTKAKIIKLVRNISIFMVVRILHRFCSIIMQSNPSLLLYANCSMKQVTHISHSQRSV